MSYLRYSHPLQWFNADSTEYVYPCGDNHIEDYNSGYTHLPSLVELVGRMVLHETKDFKYATKIVVALACKLGIKHKLLLSEHIYDAMELERGNDYRGQVEYWMAYFQNDQPPRAVFHSKDDDLDDFDYLDTFEEEELYDVKKHFDELLDEIIVGVRSVLDKVELLSPVDVDASVYKWSPICDDNEYELEATIKFEKTFTEDPEKEELELMRIEKLILESGILDDIGKRVGEKIGVCCYVPFSFLKD